MQCPALPRYRVPLMSKYLPQHHTQTFTQITEIEHYKF